MSIISASIIKKPRKVRVCEDCQKAIIGAQLRLYGAAFSSDPPYVLYLHPYTCHWYSPLERVEIKEALERSARTKHSEVG